MSASVTCHLPRRVGLSGNCKRPPEGDLFFEPLRPPSFTDSPTGDEDDAVSQSSVDGSFLSRQSSDGGFVLAADLSSSESDAFVSSTPGASDTEGRHEHLVDLRNLFTRSGSSKLLLVDIPALKSSSARSSRPPPRSTQSSHSVNHLKTKVSLGQRKEPLQQLVVSVPLSVVSTSHQHLLHRNTRQRQTQIPPKESKKSKGFQPKLSLRKYLNKQRLDKSRPSSSSPPTVSLTVSNQPQARCNNMAKDSKQPSESISTTGNSTLSWDLATSNGLFPLNSSDILTPSKDREQPYVVTVDCAGDDGLIDATKSLPFRTCKSRTPVDQVAAKLVESLKTKKQSPASHPQTLACQYQTSSTNPLLSGDMDKPVSSTTSSSLTTAQPTSAAVGMESLPGRYSSKLVQTNINTFQSTLSFESLFSFYPPELVVVNGELTPAHSLSLKGTINVPSNHPVHQWNIGKRVGKRTQTSRRKHRPQKIVK